MVIFKIDVCDFVTLDLECQPPVAGDVQTPYTLSAASELVRLPEREDAQRLRVSHVLQERKHRAQLFNTVRRKAFCVALQKQALDRLMFDALDFHLLAVA